MLLLLFDIDGTLVFGATDAHRDALHAALREVHGVEVRSTQRVISPAGRTDTEIARALLLDAGISANRIDDRADDVREACCRAYAQLSTEDLSHTVLHGVPALLEWLGTREDVGLGLVTGNYEPIARLKLKRAGIGTSHPARARSARTPRIARHCPRSRGGAPARSAVLIRGTTRS